MDNIQQAEFYIYATDGSLTDVDTIPVREGYFDWECPLTDETVLYLVYPNLNEQVIFARPGDRVKFRGDANQLRAVSIEGNPENEALTRFRKDHLQATPDSVQRAMQAYIRANPDSRVSSYLQRQLTAQRAGTSRVRKGQQLPAIVLPPDTLGGDTLRLLPTDSKARPVLIYFWATWRGDSRSHALALRDARRRAKALPDSLRLQLISISLDFDQRQYDYAVRADSIDYDRRRYPEMWDAPICDQLGIRQIPYYILVDHRRRVVAASPDWKTDIQPELDKMLKK